MFYEAKYASVGFSSEACINSAFYFDLFSYNLLSRLNVSYLPKQISPKSASVNRYLADFGGSRLCCDRRDCGCVQASLGQTLLLGLGWRLAGCSSCRYVLNRDAMRGDVVDLPWCGHINQIIGLYFYLVSRWQESVKTHNEVWVALKELGDAVDDSWSVYAVNTKNNRPIHFMSR